MTELRDELAALQRESVPAAQIQRAVALFDPVWDLLLIPERFRILHLLLESVVYDGASWPGNVAELRGAVWRLAAICKHGTVRAAGDVLGMSNSALSDWLYRRGIPTP